MTNNSIFILGNGPSLRGFDFNKLNNIPTMGLNAAYRYWEKVNWYPTYYCCLDLEVLESHKNQIKNLILTNKVKKIFVRQCFVDLVPALKNNPNVITYEKLCTTSNFFKSQQPGKLTTGSHCIRFAMSLGFTNIYLLGIDLRYVEMIKEAKKQNEKSFKLIITETPKNNPNYFFDEYQQKGDRYHLPNPHIKTENLHQLAFEVLHDDMAKFKFNANIFNCNKNSVLYDNNIFPYRTLAHALGHSKLDLICVNCINKPEQEIISFFTHMSNFKLFQHHTNINLVVLIAGNLSGTTRGHITQLCKKANLEDFELSFEVPTAKNTSDNTAINFIINNIKNSKYSLLLELEAYPIRNYWARDLLYLDNPSAWFTGAMQNKLNRTLTISGIYQTQNQEFKDFFNDKFIPWYQVVEAKNQTSYNIALADFFQSLKKDKNLWPKHKQYYAKFLVADWIEKGRGQYDSNNIIRLAEEKPKLLLVTTSS